MIADPQAAAVIDRLRGHISRETARAGDAVYLRFHEFARGGSYGVISEVLDASVVVRWRSFDPARKVWNEPGSGGIGILFWRPLTFPTAAIADNLERDFDPPPLGA